MNLAALRSIFGRFSLLLLVLVGFAIPAFGQPATTGDEKSGQGTSQPARKKISDSRRDDPSETVVEPSKILKTTDVKKVEESEPVGFLGDTRKFSRLGGWGSFGSGMARLGFARTTLIMMPPVQDELKITVEQKKKIQAWQDGMRKKGEEMGRAMREKNGDDPFKASQNQSISTRIVQFTSLMNRFTSFAKENEAELARILNAPQRKRLDQISLQMEGFPALVRPEIAEELGMDEDQIREIQGVLNQSQAQQMTTWMSSMMSMQPNRPDGNNPNGDPTPPATTKSRAAEGKRAEDSNPNPDPEAEAKARLAREKAMKQGFETMRDRTDQIHNQAAKQIGQILMKAQIARFEILLGSPFDPRKLNNLGQPRRQDEPKPIPEVKPSTSTGKNQPKG